MYSGGCLRPRESKREVSEGKGKMRFRLGEAKKASRMDCIMCGLRRGATQVIWGVGPVPAALMLVGEAPGYDEDQLGEPFVGRAGYEMDWLLASMGIPRERVYITNVVKCRPPSNRDPNKAEIDACSPYLDDEVAAVKPQVIGAVGRAASRYFLGDVDMEQVHGIPHQAKGRIVVPVYHPAAGLHDPSNMALVQSDFRVLIDVLRGVRNPRHVVDQFEGKEHYETVDGWRDVAQIMDAAEPVNTLALDTEWARGKPWCLSFSIAPGSAFVIMADQTSALDVFNQVVSSERYLTLIHNALYDLPVLAQMGVYPARFADTMVMAYLLQAEPQALKLLAYRHLGMRMKDYGDMVRDATYENAMAYLMRAEQQKWKDPQPVMVWDKGQPRVKQPQNIGRKIRSIIRDVLGKGADPWKRWYSIKVDEGRGQVEAALGAMVEGDLSDIDVGDAVWYSGRDADATLRLYPILWEMLCAYDMEDTFWRDIRAMPMVEDMMDAGIMIDDDHFAEMSAYFQQQMDKLEADITRATGVSVNPGSAPQVQQLLYEHLGIRTGRGKYGMKKDTRDATLSRLADAHPCVQMIRDWRGYQKLKTSYADVIPQKADKDGRVHTTIRITRTVTGRLASSDPNLMAQPVRTAEGRRIRDGYIAPPGCKLVSCDYSQVEMRVTASESEDKEMLRIFHSGKDIHAQTASRMFGIPIGNLDEMKHRYPAKRVGFGVLNDISAMGLQREMIVGGAAEADWSVSRCEELIAAWFDVYRGVAAYMKHNREHALRYGYVKDMWGRIRLIPGVRAASRNLKEEALRQAGNAPIQMGAQGVIKEAMGRLVPVYRQLRQEGQHVSPIIQIHDDIVMEMGDGIIPMMVPLQISIMESVAPQMRVPLVVDAKIGQRWGSLTKWRG